MPSQYRGEHESLSTRPNDQPRTDGHDAPKPNRRGQSSSLSGALKRLLPSHRPERGSTLRTHGYHDQTSVDCNVVPTSHNTQVSKSDGRSGLGRMPRRSTPVESSSSQPTFADQPGLPGTHVQRLYQERREKRRRRRSLKESGDYLGVQGVNPATGELDVTTPTSSSASATANSELASLAQTVQSKREAFVRARRLLDGEKMRKWERDKEAIKTQQRRDVRWLKEAGQWSSAVEPSLSPIAQSLRSVSPGHGSSGETVKRTPVRHSPNVEQEPSGRPCGLDSERLGRRQSYSDPTSHSRDGVGSLASTRAATWYRRPTSARPSQSSVGNGAPRIKRKPVPRSAHTLTSGMTSSSRTALSTSRQAAQREERYSDLIPVDTETTEITGEAPPVPPKDGILPSPHGRHGESRGRENRWPPQRPYSAEAGPGPGPEPPRSSVSSEPALGRASPPESSCLGPAPAPSSLGSQRPDAGRVPRPGQGHQAGERRRRQGRQAGPVCLHTHHHHYWLLSDSGDAKTRPVLGRSRRRVLRRVGGADDGGDAGGDAGRAGDFALFPDEGGLEALAESRPPPSRNTKHRYYVDG